MKKLPFRLKVIAGSICFVASAAAFAGNAITAQSVMVNLWGDGDFGLTETDQYKFNTSTASSYFTNQWDGNAPVISPVTCSVSNGGSSTLCSQVADPSAPAMPAPDASYVDSSNGKGNSQGGKTGSDQQMECTFFDGGTLSGQSYKQSATSKSVGNVTVGTGKSAKTYTITKSLTYTWNYVVAPTQSTVPALTAWDLVKSEGGGGVADITMKALIAGESVVVSNQFPTGKHSFSLSDSSQGYRISNLVLSATSADNSWTDSQPVNSTLVTNDPSLKPNYLITDYFGSMNFPYAAPAAYVYGNTTAKGFLVNGNAGDILLGDVFTGNYYGGADGSALAAGVMDPVVYSVPVGDYNVTLSGIVKGNAGVGDFSFAVSKKVHVIGRGCGSLTTQQ
jgi:hypothetical protein